MLSRRNARVKVMQTLYAFNQDEEVHKESLKRTLSKSINQSYELFIYNLLVLKEVAEYSRTDAEIKRSKYLPSKEELELANPKIADNPIIQYLNDSEQINKLVRKFKIRHFLDQELNKQLFQSLASNDKYKVYVMNEQSSVRDDRKILEYLYEEVLLKDENFQQHMEESFPVWHDDADIIAFSVKAALEELQKERSLKKINEFVEKLEEAEGFANEILSKTLDHSEEYTKLIAPKLKNWEVDRIAIMDMILMKMALTEILDCPTIPLKVTMNEYIDISKKYSTPKSKEFINGVLDKLTKELKEEGKIYKSGRGLNE